MSLINDQLQHEVYIQRFATDLLKSKLFPSLKEADDAVRALLGEYEEIRSAAQVRKIEKLVNAIVNDTVVIAWEDATKELEGLAVYEADYYANLVGGYADLVLEHPSARNIADYMRSALMVLGEGERVKVGAWADFVQQNTDGLATQYNNLVKAGYARGASVGQIRRSIQMYNQGLAKQQVTALARTGAQHYANSAREAMALDNADIIKKRYFLSVLDNRTTIGCRALHGKTWDIDDDKYVRLPRHINCLTEDTLVSTCSDVSNIYKRWYKGRMVKITTKAGRTIKITPNHPILTLRGWVDAGSVDSSDKVVCIKDITAFSANDYKNSVKTSFGNLFASCNISVNPGSVTVRPSAAEDFHGDFTDGEVSIVNVDSFGWDNVIKVSFEQFKDLGFVSGKLANPTLTGDSSSKSFFMGFNSARGGFVSGASKLGNLFRGGFSHSCRLLLGSISSLPVNRIKKVLDWLRAAVKPYAFSYTINANSRLISGNNVSLFSFSELDKPRVLDGNARALNCFVNVRNRNAESLSDIDWHNATNSELDDVVSAEVFEFSGHVYNLENKDNWYLSNDIVTHNCRSSYLYLLEGQEKPEGRQVAIGSGKDYPTDAENKPTYKGRKSGDIFDIERVNAGTTADSWLRSQSEAFIIDSLGPTRAKLFIAGEPLERMADAFGNPLTLEQMRQRDAEAFKRAGLEGG